jgi:hypothetical protein
MAMGYLMLAANSGCMSTITATLPRDAMEPTAAYAVRGRRQKVAVLAVATLLGIWLGTSAPGVSPVATPPVPASPNAVIQVPAAQDPGPLDPGGPFDGGRRR